MTKYDDVKDITTKEYFNGNDFSIDAFNKKYVLYEGETYVHAVKRVCDYIASAEETAELQTYWSARWFDEIYNDWWHPGGSIMQGAANARKISLANCTTLSLGTGDDENEWDSLEGIIRGAAYTTAKTAAYRQGLGIDFSRIRPKQTKVYNSSNESEGVLHWMKFIDSIGYYVGQSGRIPAMLFSIRGDHPDVLDFIEVKKDFTKIQNANVSVQLNDAFYEAVMKDADWELKFEVPAIKAGERIYVDAQIKTEEAIQSSDGKWYVEAKRDRDAEVISKKIKAKDMLSLIAKNMHSNAEPGVQNIDIARRMSNSDAVYDPKNSYDSRIVSTNACSEQYLSRDSLCVLASANAGKFSFGNECTKEINTIAPSMNRFLDNVNEMELRDHRYATPMQAEAIRKLRRTGAGITNVAERLFKQVYTYDDESAISATADFFQEFNHSLYKSSIELGKEKGNFEMFDKDKIRSSAFIKKMEEEGLDFTNLRNVTVSSIAPTGTLSLMFSRMTMSSGVEPAFGLYYWKRTRITGQYEYYFCVPYAVREAFEEAGIQIPMETDTIKDTWDGKHGKKVAEYIDKHFSELDRDFTTSLDIDPKKKLNLMSELAKHIDSSLSVTFMLPEDSKVEDVEDFIMSAWKQGLKSIAAFPDRKMYGIVSFTPFRDLAFKLKDEGVQLHQQNFTDSESAELHITKDHVKFSTAPARPKELEAEIHTISVKGEKFAVAVGLLNGAPYELFGGEMNGLKFKFASKNGKLIKVSKNIYKLEIDGGIEIADFSKAFTPVEQVLFRMVSANLRHGTPVKFIVEQLHKATDDMTSLTRAAARVLKKYINDGETAVGVECPECGSTSLIYEDGCVSCACGFSRCD